MSGTRSHSPPAPATEAAPEALLIAAHGDCGGAGGNILAGELARRVRLTRRFDEVAVGYMRGEPSIEDVAAHMSCPRIRIYPLLMSDGYYVREAIPRRLGLAGGRDPLGHQITIDQPLGLDPKLPGQLLSAAAGAAHSAGVAPAAAHLLLVAHGSANSSHSADVARLVAAAMSREMVFATVEAAFLEEAPLFRQALASSPRPVFVLGLFAGCGMHADDDIHRIAGEPKDPRVHIVEQLGGYAGVIELVVEALSRPIGKG